jgi:hypothetical protein
MKEEIKKDQLQLRENSYEEWSAILIEGEKEYSVTACYLDGSLVEVKDKELIG